jgi:hypothetical protein
MALPFTPDSADASILLLWSVFGQVVSEIAKGNGGCHQFNGFVQHRVGVGNDPRRVPDLAQPPLRGRRCHSILEAALALFR